MNKLTRLKNNLKRRGQGMTEYIIIVALIAIAAIGVITVFGNDIRQIFDTSNSALTGDTSSANHSATYGTKNATLKNYGSTSP